MHLLTSSKIRRLVTLRVIPLLLIALVIIHHVTSLTPDPNCGSDLNPKHRTPRTVIRAGILLPADNRRLFSIRKVLLAIQYAFQSPRVRALLPKTYICIFLGDSKCNSIAGPIEAFNMLHIDKVHVIFGPVCDYSLGPVARYAPYWNTPVISPGGMAHDFGDGKEFALLTRVGFKFDELAQLILTTVTRYNWNNIKILYSADGHSEIASRFCFLAMSSLSMLFKQNDIRYDKVSFEQYLEPEDITQLLLSEVGVDYSIVVLCTSPDSIRSIMIQVADLNFDNGDYVFFNIDLFSSEEKLEMPWSIVNDTDDHNEKARHAYKTLITFTLKHPESAPYRNFSDELHRRSIGYFNYSVYRDKDDVNTFVGCFHDAVLLFALGVNETLAAGGSLTDGKEISRRMWNRTIEGITGTVTIDEFGDRNFEYSVLDMDPDTSKFQVVANYHGATRSYEPFEGRKIHWGGKNTSPPPSRPRCGYDNSLCPNSFDKFPSYSIAIVILSLLVIVVTVAVVSIYRHYKREAALAEVNWRVRWDDIIFGFADKRKIETNNRRLSMTARKMSLMTNCSTETAALMHYHCASQPTFIKTGVYKGSVVAIKKLCRPINVTRQLLLEFARLRDLQHEHIVRFIGVCIDAPNQCIITEYCTKGSLQNILESFNFKLDSMFKVSMMQDIVRGMSYLHASDVRSHGNLKSSSCVIDSRFVLKITNFGLHGLRVQPELSEVGSYSYYRELLWTAPELLRMDEVRPPQGSRKGDVYSFAIICQEIIYRRGPFWIENENYTPQDIYSNVKAGIRPLTRPTLSASLKEDDACSDEVVNLVSRCWSEIPGDRPDFQSIVFHSNRDSSYNSDGLLDNLLLRMEQYAYNLEALVDERTADYLEQKQRAEDLLYMMLPRSVAVQLMMGELVQAEKFESVTVAFSDICGFTALSAESTPMQVVDMLNDLYTSFDTVIDTFDVYKVETIGDAYMVASGLPVRNGDLHACEISRMSLALLNVVRSFKVRHKPQHQLKLRIGIHTGPVCAGIVGMTMPRYCLFGDTVNTASRMESHGQPMKIHVSQQTKNALDSFDIFILEPRGVITIKGKGEVTTWWLIEESRDTTSLRQQSIITNSEPSLLLTQLL